LHSQTSFLEKLLEYIKGFEHQLPELPDGILPLLPYNQEEVSELAKQFYNKFYSNNNTRSLILGINPGRLGAGSTGIPFTDAKRLFEDCGIQNQLKSYEPSSVFIYKMIEAYGGVELFYSDFFISSTSPIGFVKNGKNYNYYDEKNLLTRLKPYMLFQLERLLNLDLKRNKVFCLGEGKNYQFLNEMNKSKQWFGEIQPLPHPRFIVQYKSKELDAYIDRYLQAFILK
jgi:hypothetical protein